jgi:integrase
MPTLSELIDVYAASRDWDAATISRLSFWYETLGTLDLADVGEDEVDRALAALAARGNARTGAPLKPSTINRYVSQLEGLFRYARKLRLLPRGHRAPTQGTKEPEPADPNRYLRPEEVERLITAARLVDRRWGKLATLIRVLATTGLRIGNVLELRWVDVDLERRTLTVVRTKNGRPHVATMPRATAEAIARLPGQFPSALVFGGSTGRPYNPRRLWRRAAVEAGLPRATPHWLRHSYGYALAQAGAGQGVIMQAMGHRTLSAAARYVHQSVDDRRDLTDRIFG